MPLSNHFISFPFSDFSNFCITGWIFKLLIGEKAAVIEEFKIVLNGGPREQTDPID